MGENSAHPLQWEFPGGKIKEGETAEECITREIMEELDIEIEIIQSLESITHDYGLRKIELIPFLCRIKSGQVKLKEHRAIEWLNLKKMETMELAGADKKLIRHPENRIVLEKHFGKKMNHSR